jgi:Tol biopolymer transport system component
MRRLVEQQEKEKIIASLPPAAAAKARQLEAEHAARPDAVAVCIQLANLYKEHDLKEYAVAHLTKAVKLDPQNKFLEQKLRLLIGGERPEPGRIAQIEKEQAESKRLVRIVFAVIGVVILAVGAYVAKRLLFPDIFCLARAPAESATVNPRFSPDGTRVAYLEMPRDYFFRALDEMQRREPKGETWLMAGPIGGKPARVAKIGKGMIERLDFAWRPKSDELTFQWWDRTAGQQIYRVSAKGGAEPEKFAPGDDGAWSRDGRLFAYVKHGWWRDEQEGLYVRNLDTGVERRVSTLDCSHPHWSPVANQLVFQARDPRRIREMIEEDWRNPDADRAKSWRRFAEYVGDIYQWDELTDQTTQLTRSGAFRAPAYTPDGGQIAVLTYASPDKPENTLALLDRAGGEPTTLLAPGGQYEYFGDFDFSPDGKTVAFEGFFRPDSPLPAPTAPMAAAGFHGVTMYLSDIFLVQRDGSGLRRLTSSRHPFKNKPTFSPDGKLLAYEVTFLDWSKEVWAMKVR